jgi:alpha-2-macroglobulin
MKSQLKLFAIIFITLMLISCEKQPAENNAGAMDATIPAQNTAVDEADRTGDENEANRTLDEILAGEEVLYPVVLSVTPSDSETLTSDSNFVVQFSQPMDVDSVENALTLISENEEVLPGSFEWNEDNSEVTFVSNEYLLPGGRYELSISEQAQSADGVSLNERFLKIFYMKSPLRVVEVFPKDDSQDVLTSSEITVLFSQPVVPLTIHEERDELLQPIEFDPPVEGSGKWVNTSMYVFTPEKPLTGSTRYALHISESLKPYGADDSLALGDEYIWQFKTMGPTFLEGRIGNCWIDNSSKNCGYGMSLTPEIHLTFSQEMNIAKLPDTIHIYDADGKAVPLKFSPGERSKRDVVAQPISPLKIGGLAYTFVIDAETESKDGGTLPVELTYGFITDEMPEILSVGDEIYYGIHVRFNHAMNEDSIRNHVVINPPIGDNYVQSEFYGNRDEYVIGGFAPSTTYEITFLPGIKDIYGYGTKENITRTITTDDLSAFLKWEGDYGKQYRDGTPIDMFLTFRNISELEFKIYKIPHEDYITALDYGSKYYPTDTLIWKGSYPVDYVLNETYTRRINLEELVGQTLEQGTYYAVIDGKIESSAGYYGTRIEQEFAIVSANLTMKTSYEKNLVWVTDLTTGEPVPGVEVTLWNGMYQSKNSYTTDDQGIAYYQMPFATGSSYSRGYYMTAQGEDYFAISDDYASRSSADYGYVGSVYTDRQIYRPGDTIYFKGIIRMRGEDGLGDPTDLLNMVTVTITNYGGSVLLTDKVEVSDFGTFNGEFVVDENTVLGRYSLQVDSPSSSGGIGGSSIRIADYRKPEYYVDYDYGGEMAYVGDPLDIDITAKYYSGGTLANAPVYYSLDIGKSIFTPPTQYSGYTFTNSMMHMNDQEEYLWFDGEVKLDDDGSYTIHVPEDVLKKLDNRQLVGSVAVMDDSRWLITSPFEIPVLSGKMFSGIKSHSYLGKLGEESLFDVLLLDYEGNPVPEYPFEVEIFSVTFEEYFYTNPYYENYYEWYYYPVFTSVKKISGLASDEDAKATVPYTPTEGGSYYIVTSVKDAQGYETKSGKGFWVPNWRYGSVLRRANGQIEVVPDKDSYLPGETANILVETPYEGEVYALVTLETDQIKEARVVKIDSADPVLKLPITYDLFTRVYFDVTLVKGADDLTPVPEYKHGGAFINVSTAEKELFLEVTSAQPYAAPGEEVTYDLIVKDYDGNPVEAELSLALVDKSLIALTGQQSYDFIDTLYPLTEHHVGTGYSMAKSIEATNAELSETVSYWEPWDGTFPPGEAGGGGGGGYLDAYDYGAIRENFKDTAYWRADIETDKDGKASVTIPLPDNLTTWQLTAVAITQDAKVGYERTEIVSNKPLMITPQAPRFFVVGDESTLRANVFNNTTEEMEITVSLDAEGVEIQSDVEQVITLEAGKQAYVTWDVAVPQDSERVDFVFAARSGEYSDASRPTLATVDGQGIPVYRYDVPETVSTSGALDDGGLRTELIQLPQSMQVQEASLDITIEPSLLVGMKDGLSYLQTYPYDCNEQLISKFLPNLITYQALDEADMQDTDLKAQLDATITSTIPKLKLAQLEDGGWGWWADSKESSPMISAYVMYGLWHAQEAGYDVDESIIRKGKTYLINQIVDYSDKKAASNSYQVNRLAFMVYVYAHYDDKVDARAMALYERWPLLSLESRAYLAYALDLLGGHDDEVTTLMNSLVDEVILSASGAHWEEISNDRWNWNTDTRSTAVILDTMIRFEPDNPITANAVRWLMRNREDGHWASTQETAWTLLSLSDWMKVSGDLTADYEYALKFNGEEIGNGAANQETLEEIQTLEVNIASFMQDELNRLTVARSDGDGNLYYTVDYTANLPVKDVQALNEGVQISREYFAVDDLETPLTQANQGDLLVAKITIELPASSHYLLVDDMLPAGMEIVDPDLETSQEYSGKLGMQSERYSWWWHFDHSEFRDEKVVLTAEYLPQGTYTYTYLVQASFPGTYNVIPTVAQEFYFPDVYGRGDGSQFVILP